MLPIMASQNLSSSSLSSDSVGSTINVPTTGHDVVGEWKPGAGQVDLVRVNPLQELIRIT